MKQEQTVTGVSPWTDLIAADGVMLTRDEYNLMTAAINDFYTNCTAAVDNVNTSPGYGWALNGDAAKFSATALKECKDTHITAKSFNEFLTAVYTYAPAANKKTMIGLIQKYSPNHKNKEDLCVYAVDTIIAAELFNQLNDDVAKMSKTFTTYWY